MTSKPSAFIHIPILAIVSLSGKCVILKKDADLSGLDETKFRRRDFVAEPKNTGHIIRANETVFEVLQLSGIKAGETGAYSVPMYNAAYRIALGVVRCKSFTNGEFTDGEKEASSLTVSEFLSEPLAIQEFYLAELDKSDQLDQEDWDFFKKPASAGGKSSSSKSSSENKTA